MAGNADPSNVIACGHSLLPRVLPVTEDVEVSVVVPVHNRADLTYLCLQSLSQTLPEVLSFELIVVDNGSTDATPELLDSVGGDIVVIRNEENLGYGVACNQGAERARGRVLVFLNNDTVCGPKWIDHLLDALAEDAAVGAVQPRLVYPDGRLCDAGGQIFAGGEAWLYGRAVATADAPEFTCRRAPDYVSGACLAVRAHAFRQVGGFDHRYAPAYYEDVDLSFALRAAGWKLLYEPASLVSHLEGGTAGTDLGRGLKSYQVRNRDVFAAKWAAELSARPVLDPLGVEAWAHRPQGGFGPGEGRPAGEEPLDWARAMARSEAAQRILFIATDPPRFDAMAGGLRQLRLLEAMRRAGHHVTFYGVLERDRRYARALERIGITCFGPEKPPEGLAGEEAARWKSVFMPHIGDLVRRRRFDTVVFSPFTVAEALASSVREMLPGALLVLDTIDVGFVREMRGAEVTGDAKRMLQAGEVKERELAACRSVDRVVCVTEADACALRHELQGADVVVVPLAYDLVDSGPGFGARSGLCFVANLQHRPNLDAVELWRGEIGPLLAKMLPGVVLSVVGFDPEGRGSSLEAPGIRYAGWVPDTLPVLHSSRIAVAPLRYGAGMKGKILEAMAAGLPVVTTPVGAEGIGIVGGEHALVAEGAGAFADAVARLYTDEVLWERLRDAGRSLVKQHFGTDRMSELVPELLAPRREQPAGHHTATRL